MISLKTMPGTWEGEVAEVMWSPWILMELERRDWSSLLTFSDSCSMVLSFSRISSRRATFSATRVEMDFSMLSILASWLPKESNLGGVWQVTPPWRCYQLVGWWGKMM